ncbi:hypothetical protein [Streptomyces mirabilis]|uniref:hypothetical protein n=1 Tax=Streptomyces mirabilis TaxID=68239 RepID=UPI0036E67D7B
MTTCRSDLVHGSPMLVALESLFEAEWERAVPVSVTGQTPPAGTAEEPAADGPDVETAVPECGAASAGAHVATNR